MTISLVRYGTVRYDTAVPDITLGFLYRITFVHSQVSKQTILKVQHTLFSVDASLSMYAKQAVVSCLKCLSPVAAL